jgi:hypothetical protein
MISTKGELYFNIILFRSIGYLNVTMIILDPTLLIDTNTITTNLNYTGHKLIQVIKLNESKSVLAETASLLASTLKDPDGNVYARIFH